MQKIKKARLASKTLVWLIKTFNEMRMLHDSHDSLRRFNTWVTLI